MKSLLVALLAVFLWLGAQASSHGVIFVSTTSEMERAQWINEDRVQAAAFGRVGLAGAQVKEIGLVNYQLGGGEMYDTDFDFPSNVATSVRLTTDPFTKVIRFEVGNVVNTIPYAYFDQVSIAVSAATFAPGKLELTNIKFDDRNLGRMTISGSDYYGLYGYQFDPNIPHAISFLATFDRGNGLQKPTHNGLSFEVFLMANPGQIPEPSAAVLLLVGAVAGIVRRRK